MIHYNTTNNSFLKVHLFLKKKGIKNNAFFLELYDEKLKDINPLDEENLSDDIKRRVIVELTRNPWYFLREVCVFPDSGRYEAHLGNIAFSYCAFNNINHYVILPRQTGKTAGEMAILVWLMYFGASNANMMLYAQSDDKLDDNMGRIKAIRDKLPSYLRLNTTKDKNGEVIGYKTLGNSVSRMAPGKSEEIANQKFRGRSNVINNYDEFAFIPHIKQQYQSSVLAYMEVARKAERDGRPHYIAITTTAGYLNTKEGVYAFNFLQNCLPWSEDLYDISIEDLRTQIKNNAKNDYVYIEYQYWDLGKSDDYFEQQCKALEYDKDAIDREVLCKWKAVSTVHPLGQQVLSLLDKNKRQPIHTVILNKIFRMKMYKDPETLDWSIPYIIGGDCANNVGSDYSALVVLNPYTYEVVATIRTNMFSTMLFAGMLADLMTKYFYRSILVLERNLNGATIIDRLVEINFSLASRIYGPLDEKTKQIKEFGINTNEQSRKMVYGQVLKIAVDDSYDRIYDRVIIDEISALITTRNGRIDHPVGGHDDLLISYLFTRWFLLFGNNIDRYINPLTIGCLVHDFDKNKGDEEKMRSIMNEKLSDISDMAKRKKSENNKSIVDVDVNINATDRIRRQRELMKSGAIDNDNGIGIRNLNKVKSTANDVFNSMYGMMGGRYDPDIEEQMIRQADDGKLYTLDPEEQKKEEDALYDEKIQMNDYNRNMHDDLEVKAQQMQTPNQFLRNQQSYIDNSENDELKYFFNHLR